MEQDSTLKTPTEVMQAQLPVEGHGDKSNTALVVPREDGNVSVTALMPQDMQHNQNVLIAWASKKVMELQTEAIELRRSADHAKARKWKWLSLHKHAQLTANRVIHYQKLLAALQAGFVIVPNFPVTLFAVRKEGEAKGRGGRYMHLSTHYGEPHTQTPDHLPVGGGEYRNPKPKTKERQQTEWNPAKNSMVTTGLVESWPVGWDEIEFPFNMAKPEIMEATSNAMALKIFDQFGVLPSPYVEAKRRPDPIIVGQLRDPRDTHGKMLVTFMVAWHLDTRGL